MQKITTSDLNIFFQDGTTVLQNMPEAVAYLNAVNQGAQIEDDAATDAALAAILMMANSDLSKKAVTARKKIMSDHPILKTTLSANVADDIRTNIAAGQHNKAKAYMLNTHLIRFANTKEDIEHKWKLMDTLNEVSANKKLDERLRMRAFTAALEKSKDESDEVMHSTMQPFTQEINSQLYCPVSVATKLAAMICNPETGLLPQMKNKPDSVNSATLILSYEAQMAGFLYQTCDKQETREELLTVVSECLQAMEKLEDINPKAYAAGWQQAEERFVHYRAIKDIKEMAQEVGATAKFQTMETGFAFSLQPKLQPS